MNDQFGMSGEQIERVFGALSRIETKVDGFKSDLVAHIADDKNTNKFLYDNIQKLNLGAARQKGIMTALGAVGTVLGAGVGYAVDLLTRGAHH
jgi:hypothetical protein